MRRWLGLGHAVLCVALASGVVGSTTVLEADPAAAAPDAPTDACQNPTAPDWFHDSLVTAIEISDDLPSAWADSAYLARIVCWQDTAFDVLFFADGGAYHDWHGIYGMTTQEVQTIAGPWMINDRDGFVLSTKCFVYGWVKCPRTTENTRNVQQMIAGLRWIWLNFGSPKVAWAHMVATGRFDSYPRPGTNDTPTTSPFKLCPVAGSVSYWDDFGQPRYVGGYHPHWGIDVFAPRERQIRAPFDGLAVAHTDGWFAGKYITVVGAKGYVRNAHVDRFAALGQVKAGTVVGYVGNSGDAAGEGTHDHFEWHPWVVPTPLHQAPSGFSQVMDAIDPYTSLNGVCARGSRERSGAGGDPGD